MNLLLALGHGAWLGLLALLPFLPVLAQAQQACVVRTPGLVGNYTGDCVAGYASGKGRAKGVDAYEGGFRDGHATGFGVYTFADGRRFEGEFANGKVNGPARFTYTNGDVLEGTFRDNVLSGTGRMQRANGQALLVQIQGAGMVVVGQASALPAAPPAAPGAPGTPAPGATARWTPQLDFEDLFPSYIIASATRKPPRSDAGASRSASASRGDPLAEIDAAAVVRGRAAGIKPASIPTAGSAASRHVSNAGNATYLGDPWGLVGIHITNTEPGTQVTLKVSIDEIAETTEINFDLPKAGEYRLYPKIKYRYDKLRLVSQPMPVNVSWSVTINGRAAGTQSAVTRVRSIQDAPYLVNTAAGPEQLLWVFAAFVTEDAPWLDELIRDAFAGRKISAVGYQLDSNAVDLQVQAIYDMLQKRGVRYSSITRGSGASSKVASQIVRFPSDSIRTAQANCVDGTVLMASLLRKIGIEPIIVMGPKHALLGYVRTMPNNAHPNGELRFVETTIISGESFAVASAEGLKQVLEWANGPPTPEFQLIGVGVARRDGVMPIPR